MFELSRDCAGYYEEMQQDVHRTIRLAPVICQTEDGELHPPKHWALQFRWPDQIHFFASDQKKTADKLKNQKLIILGHQFFIRNKFYKSSY
jgi:hypothetical protein